ncbi:hypothetical protein GGTG_10770 [Gaeumannomyces tritici R3-111a-1]|uniref:Uncharacterized protein n=1 Tax=Gaeumannomyces tritici (strain R3-111a-1) TaxID=644352 RepID=J3PB97_GAET3|nr:hypothetical protein GGTG_10770 [Gaeumannomyces tritici R3-111a-1]EJT71513.1 hypothetical protein GGTG_10770 [Gaeumannomyces tritici R3-111a-1]
MDQNKGQLCGHVCHESLQDHPPVGDHHRLEPGGPSVRAVPAAGLGRRPDRDHGHDHPRRHPHLQPGRVPERLDGLVAGPHLRPLRHGDRHLHHDHLPHHLHRQLLRPRLHLWLPGANCRRGTEGAGHIHDMAGVPPDHHLHGAVPGRPRKSPPLLARQLGGVRHDLHVADAARAALLRPDGDELAARRDYPGAVLQADAASQRRRVEPVRGVVSDSRGAAPVCRSGRHRLFHLLPLSAEAEAEQQG